MAWTVTVVSKGIVNGRAQVLVRANDGANQIENSFNIESADGSIETMKAMVRGWLDAATASVALLPSIPIGVVDVAASTPTPAEVARAAYRADCILMRRLDHVVKAGITLSSAQAVVDCKARLLANYQAGYLEFADLLP